LHEDHRKRVENITLDAEEPIDTCEERIVFSGLEVFNKII